jgi:chromosomal replication initiator protein
MAVVRETIFQLPADLSVAGTQPLVALRARPCFVGGMENLLVRTAAESLQQETLAYNPLVLFGGSGVGKTTLARIFADLRAPGASDVLFTTGNDFTRTFGQAHQHDSLDTFRQRLRRVAVLVIDDVHTLADKTPSQQELVRTLDALTRRGSLIIFTLRQAPTLTNGLIPSLVSRLGSGLTLEIAPPGPATKRTLVDYFAQRHDVSLSATAIQRLTDDLPTNTKTAITGQQLERAILALREAQSLAKTPLTDEQTNSTIRPHLAGHTPLPQDIVLATARYCRVPVADVRGPSRRANLVHARSLAMFLIRSLTGISLHEIGKCLGDRDHTTVLHALRKIESLMTTDPTTKQAITELSATLTAPPAETVSHDPPRRSAHRTVKLPSST